MNEVSEANISSIFVLYYQWKAIKEPYAPTYDHDENGKHVGMNKEWRVYYHLKRKTEEAARVVFKETIKLFAEENGLVANVRLERFSFNDEGINFGDSIAIYNNIGGLTTNGWLNKIVIAGGNYPSRNMWTIRSHKARTDAKFLKPMDEKFLAYVEDLMGYIRAFRG